ncbi:MAG: GntR family transcriptional regulator [Betaproteobacteria bacterium]|nr:GntR family transcriptional regulator [Betaproteobacteria bacterium]
MAANTTEMTRKAKKTNGGARGGPRRRGELQDRVVAQLRRGLMVGAFVPGQTISLRKLAGHLGTSAMPVREAINQLTAANVLEMLPNRTVCVPRMTPARFEELSKVRQALEGMAAEMACRRASPQLVKRLEKVNAELLHAIRARDILGCLARNQEFHFTLYEAADSEVLLPLIEPLWLQAGPIMYFSLISPDMPWDASAHGDVLKALRDHDAAAARRAIERDIRNTASYLLKSSVFRGASGPLVALRRESDFDFGMFG